MKVALVIGHRFDSPGACNDNYEVCEYQFNKNLTCLVENDLEEKTSMITADRTFRKTTYSMLPSEINKMEVDLIVSFHCNAFNSEVSGTETLYYHTSTKGKQCAEEFQKNMVEALGLPDRGVKGVTVEDAGGYLLGNTEAVCILLEPFFIDNDEDYEVAKGNKKGLVEAITNSIKNCKNILKE